MTASEHNSLLTGFRDTFAIDPDAFFTAPGRTEIGGNHTDHQGGHVLAAAVDLNVRAAVRATDCGRIRVVAEGFPPCQVELRDLSPRNEPGTTALVRGMAAAFSQLGCQVQGFDAYVISEVRPGSGLSSSAAFEMLIGKILNALSFGSQADAVQIAQMGQFAENVYFHKPCGLMDQLACAVGGMVAMDLSDPAVPQIKKLAVDLSGWDHALCIIHSGADHADLTAEYAAIPADMKAVAAWFGKQVLSQVEEQEFYVNLSALSAEISHRAVLRAIHYFNEDRRVLQQAQALETGDFPRFLELVAQSGRSSWMYLQNVLIPGREGQKLALALGLCERLLDGRGACRVHGGGFAGTVQAFVPKDILPSFTEGIEAALGQGSCQVLSIKD